MSDLSLLRTIITDQVQYGTSEAIGDGVTVEFQATNSPIYPATGKVYLDGVLNTDYTIDEDLGLVTFNNPPGDAAKVTISSKFTLLTDTQLTELMGQYDVSPVQLAAADALDIIASSESLIQKRIKMMDLTTDGPAVADSLRKHAKSLRELVFSDSMVESTFDIAEQINDEFGLREKITKDYLSGL